MIRAAMPALIDVPYLHLTKDVAKISADENKTSLGEPVSGKISQSSKWLTKEFHG